MKKEILLKTGNLFYKINRSDIPFEEITGFSSRNNKKRGFIFVSKILGKHYPVRPSVMHKSYKILSEKIFQKVYTNNKICFLSLAETATGLGQGIFSVFADSADSFFIHSTRYNLQKNKFICFKESHSHATNHLVYEYPHLYDCDTLVIIDDEISTGRTFVALAKEFLAKNKKIKKIIFTTLVNWLSEQRKNEIEKEFKNIYIEFISITEGCFKFCPNNYEFTNIKSSESNNEFKDSILDSNFGRLGINSINTEKVKYIFKSYNVQNKIKSVDKKDKILVLGTGEFLFYPYLFAYELENYGFNVFFQSTTRSPILQDGIIKEKITFKDNYGDNIDNFLYNFDDSYKQVFICYESSRLPKNHEIKIKNIIPLYF